jgi:uncharacterized protein YjbJ (UPF0337 family)
MSVPVSRQLRNFLAGVGTITHARNSDAPLPSTKFLGTPIAPSPSASKSKMEVPMNWDQVKGNWKQVKGKVKQQWGKLTDDELDQIEGKRDQLLGKIQKQYGISKEEAERQVNDWERQL